MKGDVPDLDGSSRRVYQSTLRALQADETRTRLITAAAECFADAGYAGTTLRGIADRAGVSVETVQLNGPKAELLLAAWEQRFVGLEGRESLLDHPALAKVLAATTVTDLVAELVEFLVGANADTAGLAKAFESAAQADTRIAVAYRQVSDRARADGRAGARLAAALNGARFRRPIGEIGDELAFLASAGHYHRLVTEYGWKQRQYRNWLHRSLLALLLPGAPIETRRPRPPGR